MPRAFSISIQSDTVDLRPALPWMAPASLIMRACSASASVIVDLPASGWEMMANVRRRRTSRATWPDSSPRRPIGPHREAANLRGRCSSDLQCSPDEATCPSMRRTNLGHGQI